MPVGSAVFAGGGVFWASAANSGEASRFLMSFLRMG